MRPIRLETVDAQQLRELDELYQTTHDARVRIRALMVSLAAERRMVAGEIASGRAPARGDRAALAGALRG